MKRGDLPPRGGGATIGLVAVLFGAACATGPVRPGGPVRPVGPAGLAGAAGPTRHQGPIVALQWSHDAVVTASQVGVRVGPSSWLRPGFRVAGFARAGDDTLIVGGTPAETGEVSLFCGETRRARRRLADDRFVSAAFVPGEAQVVVGGADGRVLRLPLPDLQPAAVLVRHTSPCQRVLVTPSGTVVSAGLDGMLFLHDLATGKTRGIADHTAGVLSLAADEDSIWSGSLDGKVRVHGLDGRLRKTYSKLRSPVVAIARTPPGETRGVACAALRNGRVAWLAGQGVTATIETLPGTPTLTDLAFAPDGSLLVAAGGRWLTLPPPASRSR